MKGVFKRTFNEVFGILSSFKGNARGCVLTEPLWGIPYNLYITYASLYMVALGCTDTQIGLLASIGLVCQMFFSLVGGYITDKLGRRRTSLIFDLISWSVTTLIWAFAQNFYYFLIAAIINSSVRVVATSWTCLFVEDTRPEERVHVFAWMSVAGILAGFFAPLAGFFVKRFTLVPAVRGLYLFAFVSMTIMFLLRNHLTHETEIGLQKMKETKDYRLKETLVEYRDVIIHLIKSPYTMIAFTLMILNNIQVTLKSTFLSILLTKGLGLSEGSIAIFPAISSAIMLCVFLFVIPALSRFDSKKPLSWGIITLTASYLLLVLSPKNSYLVVTVSTILGAMGTAVIDPFVQSILANRIDDNNRAKVLSVLYVILFAISAPFGYLGGVLSSISEKLPFIISIAALLTSILLIFALAVLEKKQVKEEIAI